MLSPDALASFARAPIVVLMLCALLLGRAVGEESREAGAAPGEKPAAEAAPKGKLEPEDATEPAGADGEGKPQASPGTPETGRQPPAETPESGAEIPAEAVGDQEVGANRDREEGELPQDEAATEGAEGLGDGADSGDEPAESTPSGAAEEGVAVVPPPAEARTTAAELRRYDQTRQQLQLELSGLKRRKSSYARQLREAESAARQLRGRLRTEPKRVARGRFKRGAVDDAKDKLERQAGEWESLRTQAGDEQVRWRGMRDDYARRARSAPRKLRAEVEQCRRKCEELLTTLDRLSAALSTSLALAGQLLEELEGGLESYRLGALDRRSTSRLSLNLLGDAATDVRRWGRALAAGASDWLRTHQGAGLLLLVAAVLVAGLVGLGMPRLIERACARLAQGDPPESAPPEPPAWRGLLRPVFLGTGGLCALPVVGLQGAARTVAVVVVVGATIARCLHRQLRHWAAADAIGGEDEAHREVVAGRAGAVISLNAVCVPLSWALSAAGEAETAAALLFHVGYGAAFVVVVLRLCYGSRGWLTLPYDTGDRLQHRLHLLTVGTLPILLSLFVVVLAMRAAGYYNLAVYIGRGLPLTAVILFAAGWSVRRVVPRALLLADWAVRWQGRGMPPGVVAESAEEAPEQTAGIAPATEGSAPVSEIDSAAQSTVRLLTVCFDLALVVLAGALLVRVWGRWDLTDRLLAALLTLAGGVALGGVAAAVALPWLLRPLRLAGGQWDEALAGALSLPVVLLAVVLSLNRGAELLLAAPHRGLADRAFHGALAAVLTVALLRALSETSTHYLDLAADRKQTDALPAVLLGRKVGAITILALGVTSVLWQMGFRVTPILASLGVGGIAVAMALQETLKNLFAGFYIMMDRSLKPGHFIQLDSGESGFIEDIGWRNTKIRPYANNMIVLPNSKLSEAVVTNENLPVQELSVYVWCGCSYESDLDHVEAVCKDVAEETMARVQGSSRDWEPAVRFKTFGDSNIDFVVVLRVTDRGAQYVLTHEFIKALHKRFNQEGIEINYPVRNVHLRGGAEAAPPPSGLTPEQRPRVRPTQADYELAGEDRGDREPTGFHVLRNGQGRT